MSSTHNAVYYHPCYREDELEHSPSREKKIELPRELKLRAFICQIIYRAARKLLLPQMSVATACFYLHNFYMKRSLEGLDKWDVAAACLFVACKAEESRRGIYKIMKSFFITLKKGKNPPGPKTDEAKKLTQRILVLEIEVLNAIDYCFQVPHPYPFLTPAIRTLVGEEFEKVEPEQFNSLNQLAWCFVNDSVRTPVSLFYPPQQIALACVDLAFRYFRLAAEGRGGSAFRFSKGWFSQFDPDLKAPVLQSICCHILDVFEQKGRPIESKHLRGLDISEGDPEAPVTSLTDGAQHSVVAPSTSSGSSATPNSSSRSSNNSGALTPTTVPHHPDQVAANVSYPCTSQQLHTSDSVMTNASRSSSSTNSAVRAAAQHQSAQVNGVPYDGCQQGGNKEAIGSQNSNEFNGAGTYLDGTSQHQQSSQNSTNDPGYNDMNGQNRAYGSYRNGQNEGNFDSTPYENSGAAGESFDSVRDIRGQNSIAGSHNPSSSHMQDDDSSTIDGNNDVRDTMY